MLTQSETRLESDKIDTGIGINKRDATNAKQMFSDISTRLGEYPTQFKEYTDSIDAFELAGTDEPGAVIRKNGQIAEFQALKIKIDEVITYLSAIEEF